MTAAPARLRVSIVTPTNDAARYVDEAIGSVSRSEAVDIEHIVVHDGDWAFAEALAVRFPQITIMRGPAEGATPAVAAAFARASGDFLLELNSDDRLVAGCLERLDICVRKSPDIRIWTGGVRVFAHGSDGREKTIREVIAREETALTLANLLDDLPLLNARFVHRSVLAEIGNLDPHFSACSDREFLIRAAMAAIPEAGLGVMVEELREHSESLTINRRRGWVPPYLAEHIAIAERWRAQEQLAPDLQRTFRNWAARERLRLAKRRPFVIGQRASDCDWRSGSGRPESAARRRRFLAAGLAFAAMPARASTNCLVIKGAMEQGSLALGYAEPGASVTVDGEKVRMSPQGVFAFGFAFDQTKPSNRRRAPGKMAVSRPTILHAGGPAI